MCLVKKPKIPKPSAEEEKDPPVIRNPFLDGMLGNIAAIRNGRNVFRIDLLNPLAIPVGGGGGSGIGGGVGSGTGGSSGGSTGGSSDSGGSLSGGGYISGGGGRTAYNVDRL